MKQTTEMKATTLGMEIKINLKNKTVTVSEAIATVTDRSDTPDNLLQLTRLSCLRSQKSGTSVLQEQSYKP